MQRHHLTSGLFPLAQQLSFNSINRFHFGVRLFSNRSQIKAKFGKNRKVAHEAQPIESLIFLSHFDFFCDILHVQTHGVSSYRRRNIAYYCGFLSFIWRLSITNKRWTNKERTTYASEASNKLGTLPEAKSFRFLSLSLQRLRKRDL